MARLLNPKERERSRAKKEPRRRKPLMPFSPWRGLVPTVRLPCRRSIAPLLWQQAREGPRGHRVLLDLAPLLHHLLFLLQPGCTSRLLRGGDPTSTRGATALRRRVPRATLRMNLIHTLDRNLVTLTLPKAPHLETQPLPLPRRPQTQTMTSFSVRIGSERRCSPSRLLSTAWRSSSTSWSSVGIVMISRRGRGGGRSMCSTSIRHTWGNWSQWSVNTCLLRQLLPSPGPTLQEQSWDEAESHTDLHRRARDSTCTQGRRNRSELKRSNGEVNMG
mmetsp:Transcript_50096/g.150811  ORF Transcript_50096/g.150811 Transcript_50096/m.150811 type:complete len:275 (+) Transcript_50096:1175-1999(+)